MTIILNGTTGITTPHIDSTGGLDAADLTGALPAIDGSALTGVGVDEVVQVATDLNSASSSYSHTGGGVILSTNNTLSSGLVLGEVSNITFPIATATTGNPSYSGPWTGVDATQLSYLTDSSVTQVSEVIDSAVGSRLYSAQHHTGATATFTWSSQSILVTDVAGLFIKHGFGDGYTPPMTVEVYDGSWHTTGVYPSTNSNVYFPISTWQSIPTGTITSVRATWTSYNPNRGINYLSINELKLLKNSSSAGQTATTTTALNSPSVLSSLTSYTQVEGSTSGWVFEASRDDGTTFTTGTVGSYTDIGGGSYLAKVTYDLSSQPSGTKIKIRTTFPTVGNASTLHTKLVF